MGLLRKAAVAVRGNTGSGKPAAAPVEKTRKKGLGLFRRSVKALQSAAPLATGSVLSIELAEKNAAPEFAPPRLETPAPAGRRLEDVIEEVLAAIASLRGGVELPSRLFTALTSLLGVRKGALLLYDPVRLVYAPWAVRGFDQTTLHRMRIPLGANDAWNALANGRPLTLGGAPVIAPFQHYFSAREFASVSRLILVPFIADEKLIAVLLLTELDSPLASEDELIACLARAAEAGAPRVLEARAAQLDTVGSTGTRPEPVNVKNEPTRFVASIGIGASRKTVLLLSLSLEEYAKRVLAAHEHLDPFRLHEDLQYFLGSFLADVGKALSVRKGVFTVALPDFDPAGLDLLIHQLTMFLHGLFGDNGTHDDRANPRIVTSVSWPADGADLRSLVESLSS